MTANGCWAGNRLVNRTKAIWEANPRRSWATGLLARERYGGRGIGHGRCPGKRAFDGTSGAARVFSSPGGSRCPICPSQESRYHQPNYGGQKWDRPRSGATPQTPEGAHHRVRPGQQGRPGPEPPDRRLEEGRVPRGSNLRGQGLRGAVAAAGAGGLPEGPESGRRAPGLASGSPRPFNSPSYRKGASQICTSRAERLRSSWRSSWARPESTAS
jgi:hypothetical protein